jgi:hypothetical protein
MFDVASGPWCVAALGPHHLNPEELAINLGE